MDISIFLAKLIVLYLLITGFLCAFRKSEIKTMAKELGSSKSALAVSGEISLIFGLVIAIDHSMWEYSWKGLVTVLGYLMILRGVLRFAFPAQVKKMVSHMSEQAFGFMLMVMIFLGGYLTYCGFTANSLAG